MTKEMRKKLVPWMLMFAFCLPWLIPWAWAKVVPAARFAHKADSLYTGATYSDGTKEYVIGGSLFDSLGTLDSAALAATNNRTLIKNAISVAAADLSILGAWTFGDSLTIAQDAVFTGGTGSGVTVNAPTTINDTLTVADSASFTDDLVATGSVFEFGTYGTIFKAVMAGQAAFTTSDLIDTVAFNTASTLTATDPVVVSLVTADTTIGITGTIGANGDSLFVTRASGGSSAAKYNYIIVDL